MARFAGKLHTWNEELGFGFIRPIDGGQDIFVHASGLPTPRPLPDEVLTFEVGLNREGKKKAMDVRRQQLELAALAADTERTTRGRQSAPPVYSENRDAGAGRFLSMVISIMLIGSIGWYAYGKFQPSAPPAIQRAIEPSARAVPAFQCDGRTFCSQMTSCEEATFFLKNCPGTKMDGDHDGIPCEQQHC
jgi:cold shock CspA family protein